MSELFSYGAGIPTYLALWLPLTPVLLVALVVLRARWTAIAAVTASTLPTFLVHQPSALLPTALRWPALMAVLAGLALWLGGRLRGDAAETSTPPSEPADALPPRAVWLAAALLAVLAVGVRAPLAWIDPGIADIPRASETAAADLLGGSNPYLVPNEHTLVGTYQYPAGSIWLHVPFVAALPRTVGGEDWFPARSALWASEALAVLLLAGAGVRSGRARGGLIAASIYALHPTAVRLSGMVVANDLLLGLAAAGCAVALGRRRPIAAAALAGLAISIKPAALPLLPLLLVAGGLLPTAIAGATAVALQLPFLLWPTPGFHGLDAITEPAVRAHPLDLAMSVWAPVYRAVEDGGDLTGPLTALGVLLACAVAAWAGWRLRTAPTVERAAAAVALALLATMLLGGQLRINFEGWYLVAFALAAGLAGEPRPHPRRRGHGAAAVRSGPGAPGAPSDP